MSDRRVLVVGTTPDYIAYIHLHHPGRALFITDKQVREASREAGPDEVSEIVCDLSRMDEVTESLRRHISYRRLKLSGAACYDCEWLGLASRLANTLDLPFPSVESVEICRSKYLSKLRWLERNVRCPQVALIHTGLQAVRFFEQLDKPIVLKPLSGSGSELTFCCTGRSQVLEAFGAVMAGLRSRRRSPMYRLETDRGSGPDPREVAVAEELAEGQEYSCDFILDSSRVQIIRVAKKLRGAGYPFGTTAAYVVPARLPSWCGGNFFETRLVKAAESLGLTSAVCMVDFIIARDEIVFLELTPRTGGDCIPPLVRHCCGIDTLAAALDFAEGRIVEAPSSARWRQMVGLRLLSGRAGVIRSIDASRLLADDRVVEVDIRRLRGHRVTLPPQDYESWLLGHVIFRPSSMERLPSECEELTSMLAVDMEPHDDHESAEPDIQRRKAAESAGPSAR